MASWEASVADLSALGGYPSIGLAFQQGQQWSKQTNVENQMAQLGLQDEGIKVQSDALALQMSKAAIQAQQALLGKLKSIPVPGQGGAAPQGDPDAMPSYVESVGLALAPVEPEKSAKILESASKMRLQQSEILERSAAVTKDKNAWIAQSTAGVHDQATWEAENAAYEQTWKEPSPFRDRESGQLKPYNPMTVAILRDSATTAVQKAEVQEKQAATLRDRAQAGKDNAEARLADARTTIEKQKADLDTKNGNIGPSKEIVSAATTAVKAAFPGELDTKSESGWGAKVAMDSQRYVTQGLTRAEAIQKAIRDNKADIVKAAANNPKSESAKAQKVDEAVTPNRLSHRAVGHVQCECAARASALGPLWNHRLQGQGDARGGVGLEQSVRHQIHRCA